MHYCLDSGVHLMTQVRLGDIIEAKPGPNSIIWKNKISSKSVDFVITNSAFEILACVELDGKTHELEKRIKADTDKDFALKSAGVPIVRIKSNKVETTQEIRAQVDQAIKQLSPLHS